MNSLETLGKERGDLYDKFSSETPNGKGHPKETTASEGIKAKKKVTGKSAPKDVRKKPLMNSQEL